jgi:serine/threonine protein kinase
VTLHRRVTKKPDAVAKEVQILVECQHQNILLLLGYVLDLKGGPALVMERTWGPVETALRLEPVLPAASAVLIAAQVASALEHLHKWWVFHGSVRTTSVYLLGAPHETPVMSKLADFSIAEMPLFDYARLQEDVFALGRFVVRLLGKRARAGAAIDAGDNASSQYEGNSVAVECVELQDLEVLVNSILSCRVNTAKEAAEKLNKMRRALDQRAPEPLDVENAAALRMLL